VLSNFYEIMIHEIEVIIFYESISITNSLISMFYHEYIILYILMIKARKV